MRRVLLQILHELVACHPTAELARNPVARKIRQPADGVQVQTVVAGAPLLSDVLAPLQDGGVYATRSQCRRSRQSPRASADDDDILHSQKATADIGRGRARSLPHPAAGIGAALRMKVLRRRRCEDSTVEPCSSTCRGGLGVRSAASSSGSGSRVVVSLGFASVLLPPGRPSQLWSSATPSGRPRSVRALPWSPKLASSSARTTGRSSTSPWARRSALGSSPPRSVAGPRSGSHRRRCAVGLWTCCRHGRGPMACGAS